LKEKGRCYYTMSGIGKGGEYLEKVRYYAYTFSEERQTRGRGRE
jgi:hypothetical protein